MTETGVAGDDSSVPRETIIYYSKGRAYLVISAGLCLLAAGIYLLIIHNYFFGVTLSIFGVFVPYDGLKRVANRTPYIILNEKGIQTKTTAFQEWRYVKGETIKTEWIMETPKEVLPRRARDLKLPHDFLIYSYTGGAEKLDLTGLTTNKDTLTRLMNIYRLRSKNGFRD